MKKTPEKIERLEEAISKASGVSIDDMRGKSRKHSFTEARHAVWYIAHDHLGFSFSLIGRVYDRDHTTVIYGAERMRKHPKTASTIVAALAKRYPGMMERRAPGEATTIEGWDL